jgi:16S rRNA processing protein RimM
MESVVKSSEPDTTLPPDAIEVARILGPWGIKGWVRIQSYAADAQAVFSSKRWFLQPAEGQHGPAAAAIPPLLQVTLVKEHGDGIIATAVEIPDRDTAERLKGARIFVSRASFPSAGVGEYYWVDLMGLDVVNRDGAVLGVVADLLDTGAHSVLRVTYPTQDAKGQPQQGERLIPFVAAYIDDVSLEQRRIVADWGLDY